MIVPFVIYLISFIFYLTFYLYNRCVVSQDSYILAFRGSACNSYGNSDAISRVCKKDPGEIKQCIIGQCGRQLGKKYVGIHTLISTAEADKKGVTVEVSGTMTVALPEQLLLEKKWGFYGKGQAERICPTQLIRNVRNLKKIKDKWNETIGTE